MRPLRRTFVNPIWDSSKQQFSETTVAMDGSVTSDVHQEIANPENFFSHVVSGFSEWVETEMTALRSLHKLIDGMWLEEMALQVHAEVYGVVIEAADHIERGTDSIDTIKRAHAKVEAAREWSMQSLMARLGNRDLISLDGGFGFVERIVLDRCAEACQICSTTFA
jgi:hypothetical protein